MRESMSRKVNLPLARTIHLGMHICRLLVEIGPKDGHDIAGGVSMIADEFCPVPKGLDEHGHRAGKAFMAEEEALAVWAGISSAR